MATTTQAISAEIVQKEKPLFNKKAFWLMLTAFTALNIFIRWYEQIFGAPMSLDAFDPEFKYYWMNFMYTGVVIEITIGAFLWTWLWRTRDRDLQALAPRDEIRRQLNHLIWMCAYGIAFYWGASFYMEQTGSWHHATIRDNNFTPSNIVVFYLSYPIFIITGMGAFLYAKTRLPQFGRGISLAYMLLIVGLYMLLPNVGMNEWGNTYWWMEEQFSAPIHYGFVFFSWMTLAVGGVVILLVERLCMLLKTELESIQV